MDMDGRVGFLMVMQEKLSRNEAKNIKERDGNPAHKVRLQRPAYTC